MTRSRTIRFDTYDSEDRAVRVVATYTPPTDPYYSRGWGWLPGDSEDIDIISVTAGVPGADVAEVEADREGLEEAVRLRAEEDDRDRYYYDDTLEEARGER